MNSKLDDEDMAEATAAGAGKFQPMDRAKAPAREGADTRWFWNRYGHVQQGNT